jgi:hypothetical protein
MADELASYKSEPKIPKKHNREFQQHTGAQQCYTARNLLCKN